MQDLQAQQNWLNKAALYEILAMSFLLTTKQLAEVLSSGEYKDALAEITQANGLDSSPGTSLQIDDLAVYQERDVEELFHELRSEYTRLFVGAPNPQVSPYAGIWHAKEIGVEPLLFVNKESMDIERFMNSCGVGQPEGTNQPLDAIGTMLEFMQYLCMVEAKAVQPVNNIQLPEQAYQQFYEQHFCSFAHKLAAATLADAKQQFYKTAAAVLAALPIQPL